MIVLTHERTAVSFIDFYNTVASGVGGVGCRVWPVPHPTRRQYVEPPIGLSPRQAHLLVDAAVAVGRRAPRLRCVGCGADLRGPSDLLILVAAPPGGPPEWMKALSCWACSSCADKPDLGVKVNQFVERAGRRITQGRHTPE
jgi:hypothetical protein